MSFKTTYVLFAVLICLLAVFGLTQLFGKKPGLETYILPAMHNPEVKVDEITGVTITRSRPKEEKVVFIRDPDKNWRLAEPFPAQADRFAIEELVRQVMDAHREEKANLTANLKQFGLETPAAVITLEKGADQKWSMNVGNESTGGPSEAVVYVTAGDQPKDPLAVRRMEISSVFKTVNEFRPKYLVAESSFDIQSVKLQEPKHELVAIDKSSEGKWRFEKPPFGEADYEGETAPGPAGANTNITGVRDLLQAVADIRVESEADFADNNASDTDLAAKGLDESKPERMRIEVKRQPSSFGTDSKKEPVTGVLLIGKKADDKGEKLFARLADSKNVVKVPAKNVDRLSKVLENPAVLRNHDLVQIDTSHVDAVDVQLDTHPAFKLRRSGDSAAGSTASQGAWKVFESGNVQEADNAAVQGLLTALTAKRLIKEFPEANKSDADLGLDKPAAVLSIWVDGIKKDEATNEKKEEKAKDDKSKDDKKGANKDDKAKDEKKDAKAKEDKKAGKDEKPAEAKKDEKKDASAEPALKDAKPTVKLVFGRKDKDLVYLRRESGGEVTRVAVPASVLEKAAEGRLAYLVKKLPEFGSVTDVSKLVLTRGKESYEIEKLKPDKEAESWKLKLPKELAGRTADPSKISNLLFELHSLQAEKLVAEKPAAGDLERYGLSTPQDKVTVTVTKDKKSDDHTYLFGKETDDKTGVYAKQGDRDLVFVVRKSTLEALHGDLLDPTVLTFDAAKVRGLKLTGWQDVVGSPFTIDVDKPAGKDWTVKAPPSYPLDTAKVNTLVANLANLKALRFIMPQGPPKPEYKLEHKDGALEVMIAVEGEKESITLTIGGPAGSDGLYARTNKLPADVFVIAKAAFEQMKSKPAYLKKE